jgi:hypothetical protein
MTPGRDQLIASKGIGRISVHHRDEHARLTRPLIGYGRSSVCQIRTFVRLPRWGCDLLPADLPAAVRAVRPLARPPQGRGLCSSRCTEV